MSNTTRVKYGYGICTDAIDVITTTERVEALLALAPEYREWMHDCFKAKGITEPTMDDYLDFDNVTYLGLAAIMERVIHEAEGIKLTACDDLNCVDYLIYEPSYPWQMSEWDLALTEEKLAAIFRKYVSILTDVPIELGLQEIICDC